MIQEFGRGFAESIHPDDLARVLADETAAIERRAARTTEYRLRGAQGDYRWFLENAAPRFNDTGDYIGQIGILIDVTERRPGEAAARAGDRARPTANQPS
jgi:PAS domain S-box-containing protein